MKFLELEISASFFVFLAACSIRLGVYAMEKFSLFLNLAGMFAVIFGAFLLVGTIVEYVKFLRGRK